MIIECSKVWAFYYFLCNRKFLKIPYYTTKAHSFLCNKMILGSNGLHLVYGAKVHKEKRFIFLLCELQIKVWSRPFATRIRMNIKCKRYDSLMGSGKD